MTAFITVVFAVTGLVFGSFLTVVVHRLPEGRSIVAPRSACPDCGSTVSPRDNVPIVSYALLAGKCRNCRSHISAEYPIVEAVTGALFVSAALMVRPVWLAAIVAPFLGVLLAAGLIDARYRIIPNRLTYPSLIIFGAVLLTVAATVGTLSLLDAGIGLLAFGGSLFALAIISPGGMGMGDVKLAALIGLVLGAIGLRYVAVAAFLAVLSGGVGALVALLMGRSRKSAIPFGPYLAAGAAAATLFGSPLSSWYASLAR